MPQTGTQKSVAIVLTAGVLVGLAFLMIKYHKKKVWMVLLITASVTSLYNLRNVMAQNETKVTTIPVTTFVPTSDHCLYGYIIIPNTSETTKNLATTTTVGTATEPTVTTATTTTSTEPTTTTAGTATEATVTTATTTTSTEPTTTTTTSTEANSAEPIFESSEVESTEAATTTEATSSTTSTNSK